MKQKYLVVLNHFVQNRSRIGYATLHSYMHKGNHHMYYLAFKHQ